MSAVVIAVVDACLTFVKLFPGLIYRMIKPKVVLLIFVSGKIVLTGAKVCPLSSSFIDAS